MIGGIVPEGLVKRLDHIATWEPEDSPRAQALKEAADVLRKLPVMVRDSSRLEDDRYSIRSYRIDTCPDPKEMRVVFFGERDQKRILAVASFDPNESYDFAHVILKNYDKIEGIK